MPARSLRRVVVTGAGVVSACGVGVGALESFVAAGRSAIGPIERFDVSSCGSRRAGLVPPIDLHKQARRIDLGSMNLLSRYATLAAKEALEGAGLAIHPRVLAEVGLVLGVFVGPSQELIMDAVWRSEDRRAHVGSFSEVVASSTNGYVSQALYLQGYDTCVSPGHQAGVAAAIVGADAIALGHADAIVVGGADELFGLCYWNYDRIGQLARGEDEEEPGRRILPGKQRVLGEGAAALVLEEQGRALARGARVLAEVVGSCSACEPGPMVEGSRDVGGLVHAMRGALERGGVAPGELDAIVWAPMGNEWDERLDRATKEVFGGPGPRRVDVARLTGYAEASSALMAAALLLGGASFRGPRRALVIGTSHLANEQVLLLEAAGE